MIWYPPFYCALYANLGKSERVRRTFFRSDDIGENLFGMEFVMHKHLHSLVFSPFHFPIVEKIKDHISLGKRREAGTLDVLIELRFFKLQI